MKTKKKIKISKNNESNIKNELEDARTKKEYSDEEKEKVNKIKADNKNT